MNQLKKINYGNKSNYYGYFIGDNGKPRTGNYNFWTTAISVGLYFLILITGGFFK